MESPVEITSINQFDELLELSEKENKEFVILKYSPQCPISFETENLFDVWVKNLSGTPGIFAAKVNVIASRIVSLSIAQKVNIRHESPQIIWIGKNGTIKWAASHFDITADKLEYYSSK